MMEQDGASFWVLETREQHGPILGSVFLQLDLPNRKAFFGMLAIRVECHGKHYSTYLIQHIEKVAKRAGCDVMELDVVNVRPYLVNFYGKFGYIEVGTQKYCCTGICSTPKIPIHLIVMRKNLSNQIL